MKRRRMAALEPWIERLVQNYGQSRSETTIKDHVIGVCDLADSQQTEHTDACMMFLSDGSAVIPAALSGAAWERLQDLEERESFSGLVNAIVYVRNFKLDFHMNSDLGQEQFIVSMPFLFIPEEQRELMTADPSADCESETPNGLAPPHEDSYPTSTSRPNQTVAAQDRNSGSCPDEGQPTLEHTRQAVLCGTGELSGDVESPWDMFTPAPDLLGQEPCSQTESQSLLKEVDLLSIAASTQEVVSVEGITLGQRTQPSQISPSHSSGKSSRETSQEEDKEYMLSPPSWIVQNTAPPSKQRSIVSPPTKPSKVHSDGKSFSYLYHPALRLL